MGLLDEPTFASHLAPCPKCAGTRLQLRAFLDQLVPTMLGDAAGAGRFVHDGEKFVDGTYEITCAGCKHVLFASDACPRCNAPGGLAKALKDETRLPVPRNCPSCEATELAVTGLVDAVTLHAGGKSTPKAKAELHEPGFHVTLIECDDCGEIAAAEDCPLCAAPAPLRPRP